MTENALRIPVLTNVGVTRANDVYRSGSFSRISHIAVGDGLGIDSYDQDGNPTAEGKAVTSLQNERVRVAIDGNNSGQFENTIILQAAIESASAEFTVSEIGIFLEDGTLFAYSASTIQSLGVLNSSVGWNYAFTMTLTAIPWQAIQLDFGTTTNPELQNKIIQALLDRQVDVTRPVVVAPSSGAIGVAVSGLALISGQFASPTGYAHTASEYVLFDADQNEIHNSGTLGNVTDYTVPDGILDAETDYSWKVRYAGALGGNTVWSDWSDAVTFTTGTADIVQETELYQVEFTSSATWVAPSGATNIDKLTGRGGTGKSGSISSYTTSSVASVSSGHMYGTADAKAHAQAQFDLLNGLSTSAFAETHFTSEHHNTNNAGDLDVSSNGRRLKLRKTGSIAKTGDLWTANVAPGTPTPESFIAKVTGLEKQSDDTPGGTTQAFGETFPGGATGAAAESEVNNIAITPGAAYQINVASGGRVVIEFEALAGQ